MGKKIFPSFFLSTLWVLVLLAGCVSVDSSHSSKPPQWFLSIPKDNANLYGNGTGKSLEISKQNALSDLASNLKIKINANTTLKNIQSNQIQDSQMEQNIQITLDSIELQNITLTHTEYKNKIYYTQLKVAKKTIVDTLMNEYHHLYNDILPFSQKQCGSISIKDKATLENVLKKLVSLKESIDSLDEFASLPSLKAAQKILKKNSPFPKAKLVFNPQAPREIISALSGEYAKFIQISDEKNIYTFKNDVSIEEIGGKTSIWLKLDFYDCQEKIIFHTQIHSIQPDKMSATNRLAVQLYKKLKEFANADAFSIPEIK